MTDSIEELISKGNECIENVLLIDALDCFQKVLSIEPDNQNALQSCASIWEDMALSSTDSKKKYAQVSETFWDKLIQLNPSNAEYIVNKGQILQYYLDDSDKALTCYQSALQLDSSLHMAWMHLGVIFSNSSDWENALVSYEKAIELDDMSNLLCLNFGITHAKMGKYEKALECFERSLYLDDTHAYAWKSKCKILDTLGRYDESKICGKKYYELTKNN